MSGQIPLFEKSGPNPSKALARVEERVGVRVDADTFVDNFGVLAGAAESIAELRRLVLTLAFQGRMSRRADTDGHAAAALKAVIDDRSWRIEERPTKAKSDPKIEALVGVTHVPRHWTECRLNDIAQLINGRAYAQPELLSAGTPVIRIQNLNGGNDWYYSDLTLPDRQYCDRGDLLFAWSASFGPYVWSGTRAIFHYHIWKLHLSEAVDKRFLYYTLSHITDVVREQSHGLAMLHMTKGQMERWPILLPPLAEQKRIVAKVDQLMALCDDLEARQTKKREIGTRLTKSALEALTTAASPAEFDVAWRRVVDNFDVLIDTPEGVAELRRRGLELAVSGRFHGGMGDGPMPRVGDYVTFQNGYAFKSEWFADEGVRLLRNTNVGHGVLRWNDLACVTRARANEFERFALAEGDVVVSLDRPIISTGVKVARVRSTDLPCLLLQRVGKVVISDPAALSSDFLFWWLNSPCFVDSIDPGRSNGVPHISTKQIEALPLALPRREIQDKIVQFIEKFLARCAELETLLRRAEDRAAKLAEAAVQELAT